MPMSLFCSIAFVFGLLPVALVLLGMRVVRVRPFLASRLTRQPLAGLVLGLPLLAWCAYEGALMLPPGFTPVVWMLVPVVAAGCLLLLDFNPARAFGGWVAMLANYLIQHAFAYNCAWRGVFCVAALLLGIAGTLCIAWPWLVRDALSWLAGHSRQSRWILGGCAVFAMVFIILPLCGG